MAVPELALHIMKTNRCRGITPMGRRLGGIGLGLAAASLALASVGVSASPLQNPKRLVSVYSVDLSPLFKWWAKHDGPRPLASWVHITGSVVGTNAAGWIVEGQVEKTARDRDRDQDKASADSHDPQKIILRTPPVEELVEFEELSSRLNTLTAQRAELAAQENDTKGREQAVEEQQRAVRRYGSHARVLDMEDRQLKKAENDTKAQEKPLDQQIKELKTQLAAYPNHDRYVVDCFALDLKSDFEQLPVYDHGQVMK